MPNTMYQVSTLQALMMGDYEGHISIRALLKKGDTGLGTFDSLHGEMILLDGICYRALEDGHVEVSQEEDRSPFAVASFLKEDDAFPISAPDFSALQEALNARRIRQGKNNENNTLNKDSCQSYLPWICDTLLCKLRNNCVCKICIQSHTGSKNYRIVGIKCHDECCESSRYSCCCKDCIRIHSCSRKNTRVYSEYVSHCKECCNAGNNLGFDISAVFFQFENLFQKKAPLKYFVETRHS